MEVEIVVLEMELVVVRKARVEEEEEGQEKAVSVPRKSNHGPFLKMKPEVSWFLVS